MDFQEEQDSSWEFQKENTDDWFVGRVNYIKYHRKHSSRDVNKVSDSSPKIHRIPQYMAERLEFRKYYEPQIISIGPIHLAKIDTLQGKPYKDAWTIQVLEKSDNSVDAEKELNIFLNLVAYEMCPDFRNHFEISSFLVFMSSLIDQPEDVKELRLADIIINELASDKEVADLFNKMDSILVPETPLFAHVRDQIDSHFKSKRGRITMLSWMGEASNTFFRSPWTIIALLAATLGLVLTFIQTWFAIHPKAS